MARLRQIAAMALAGAALMLSTPARADIVGLMIGVSDYPNLPKPKSLKAPKVDVARMTAALIGLGARAEQIETLADGVAGSRGLPTLAAIEQAFDRLPERIKDGDTVVVYMSGHGAQIADDDGDEEDRQDEAFLPRDVEPPVPGSERFTMGNALRDDRIARMIAAVREKDVTLWLIVDSCHSGTLSRAASEDVRAKEIGPADFGMVASDPASASTSPAASLAEVGKTGGKGRFVAFYGSQADEISLEIAVPRAAKAKSQTWVSAFTDALVASLGAGEARTYQALLDDTARRLRADVPPKSRQTPSFDGEALTLALPGQRDAGAALPAGTLRIGNGRIEGGLLAGLESGSVVSLHETMDGPAIGHGQVTQAAALDAGLAPVVYPCATVNGTPECKPLDQPALLAKARFGRLVRPVTTTTVRVSRPRDWPGASARAGLDGLEADLVAALSRPDERRFQLDDVNPDLVWFRTPGGYRFVPAGLAGLPEEFGPAVEGEHVRFDEVMAALGRAHTLMRIDRLRAALPSSTLPAGFARTKVEMRRLGKTAGMCGATPAMPEVLGANARLQECDSVELEIRNPTDTPVFPYIFVLDDGWNLKPWGNACKGGAGAQNRLAPGDTRRLRLVYQPGTITPGLADISRNGVVSFLVPFQPGAAIAFDPCSIVTAMGEVGTKAGIRPDPIEDLLSPEDGNRGGGATFERLAIGLETWPIVQPKRP